MKKFQYENAQQFVDDLALILWNARLYNRKDSRVYRHALILKQYVLNVVLPKFKTDKVIANGKNLGYPNLGELPDEKDEPVIGDFVFKENDFKDDNGTPQADFIPQMSTFKAQSENMQPTFPPPAMVTRQHTSSTPTTYKSSRPAESGIRRGRPPIIDKPFETRIS